MISVRKEVLREGRSDFEEKELKIGKKRKQGTGSYINTVLEKRRKKYNKNEDDLAER